MKRFLETLRVLAFGLSLLVVAAWLASLAAERSGFARDRVRLELEQRTGEPVRLDAVRIAWLERSLVLHGLGFGPAAEASEAESSELWVDELACRLGWRGRGPTVEHVELRGGRVVLSEALFRRLRRIAEVEGEVARELPPELPSIVVRDVQLDLAHAEWGELPLGLVDAVCTVGGSAGSGARIEGRIVPELAQGQGPSEVYLRGHQTPDGTIEIQGSTSGVAVTVDTLREGTALELFRPYAPSGRLALDANVRFTVDGSRPPFGHVRAALTDATVLPPGVSAPVEDLELQLSATYAPAAGEGLETHGAWDGVARLGASWRGAPVEGWLLYGRSAGPKREARAWVHVRDLAVDGHTPAELGLGAARGLTTTWNALAPVGRLSDVRIAAELAPDGALESALEVDAAGELQVAYHGYPDRTGQMQGVPLPVERVRGTLLGIHAPGVQPDTRIAFYDVDGLHSGARSESARAHAHGLVVSGEEPDQPARFDIAYGANDVPVTDEVRVALAGLRGTDFIWPTFQPSGGIARAFSARMKKPRSSPGMASRFVFDLEGVGARYSGLPVQASELAGRLELVFDRRHAFGASFAVDGRTQTADRVSVRGRIQEDPALAPGSARQLREIEARVDNVALRGADRDALVASLPSVGRALDAVGPSGKVDARYHLSLPGPEAAESHSAEVSPREVQVSPESFKVRTRNARGRILVSVAGALRSSGAAPSSAGTSAGPSAEGPLERVEVRVQPLVGEWPGDTQVAMVASFEGDGSGRMQVLGAGVDPANRGLIGAFGEAFPGTRGGGRTDLSILDADGRVDLTGEVVFQPGQDPLYVYRVFLRENAFGAGSSADQRFRLTALSGILEQRGNQLYGEDISAVLGNTRVVLESAAFAVDENGSYRATLSPRARNLPLDREHLRLFLDDATVDTLIDRLGWTGTVDVSQAQLSIEGTAGAASNRLEFRAALEPRGMKISLGLPLTVDSARVALKQLVYENGYVRAWMDVKDLSGRLADRELTGASLALTYVEPHLSVLDLSGRLEQGRVRNLSAQSAAPFFSIDLRPPFPFELALRLAEVDLSGLLRGLYESEFASRGLLSSELRLFGDLDRITGIRGEGRVEMRETSLWSIPVIRDLFSQLGFDQTAVFEEMRAQFRIHDGVIELDPMQVKSPLLKLVGSGTLDLDGRLNQNLRVEYSLVDKLGPFTRLIYFVQNNLLSVSVRGDMARPKVILHGALSFLQRLRGNPRRELPLPGFSPLPERF